jgi:SNF2 family DNA or RNA helicase
LLELIGELRDDRKAVVFYDYTWSAKQITSSLSFLLDIKHIWLWSGTKNPRKQLHRFMTDPDCRVALINNKVGAFSLDGLQEVANYLFFYESPVGVIEREQAERRVRRQGQKRKVFQYDLIVPGSVDDRILDFHKEGRDLMATIRKDPTVLLKE